MTLFCVGLVTQGVEKSKVVSSDSSIDAIDLAFPDNKPGELYAVWKLEVPVTYVLGNEKPFTVHPGSANLDIPVTR